MGRRHIQMLKSLDMEIIAAFDLNLGALNVARSEHHLPQELLFSSAHEMLEKTRPDVVIISTTAPSHCEYTRLASEAGTRFILCEKPMAVSLEECDRMIEVCHARGTALAINHPMRFMEQYTVPRTMIQSEEFGGLCSVNVVGGNFGLAMNGSHYFEMFRYITDEAPVKVTAWLSKERVANPRGEQFEDRGGCVRTITASGKRFYLEASADQGHGLQVIYAGHYGQIFVDEVAGTMRWTVRQAQYRNLPTTRYGMDSDIGSCTIGPKDLIVASMSVLKALLEQVGYPTGEEGRLAVATVVAAHVSAEEGHRPVDVDETLPITRAFPWA